MATPLTVYPNARYISGVLTSLTVLAADGETVIPQNGASVDYELQFYKNLLAQGELVTASPFLPSGPPIDLVIPTYEVIGPAPTAGQALVYASGNDLEFGEATGGGDVTGILVSDFASLTITAEDDELVKFTVGRTSYGDGGGGSFRMAYGTALAPVTTPVDTWRVFADSTGNSRFIRNIEQPWFNAAWFGMKGDFTGPNRVDATDNAPMFQLALDEMQKFQNFLQNPTLAPGYGAAPTLYFPGGNYYFDDMISFDTTAAGVTYSNMEIAAPQGGCSGFTSVNFVFGYARMRGIAAFSASGAGITVPAGRAFTIDGLTYTADYATSSYYDPDLAAWIIVVRLTSSDKTLLHNVAAGTACTINTPLTGLTSPGAVAGSGLWSVACSMRCRDIVWRNIRFCPQYNAYIGKMHDLDAPSTGGQTFCRFFNCTWFADGYPAANFGRYYRACVVGDVAQSNADNNSWSQCNFKGAVYSAIWVTNQNSKFIGVRECYISGAGAPNGTNTVLGLEHEYGHFVPVDCQFYGLTACLELGQPGDALVIIGGSTETCKQYIRNKDGFSGSASYAITQIGGRFALDGADHTYKGVGSNERWITYLSGGLVTLIGCQFSIGNAHLADFSIRLSQADLVAINCLFPNTTISGGGPYYYCDRRITEISCRGYNASNTQVNLNSFSGTANLLGPTAAAIDANDAVSQAGATVDGVVYAANQIYRVTLLLGQYNASYQVPLSVIRVVGSSAATARVAMVRPGTNSFDVYLSAPLTGTDYLILNWEVSRR